jgi:hypothetical protein
VKSLGSSLRHFAQFPNFSKALDATRISDYTYFVPSHRGALRNVTDAGRDAVDADGAFDEALEADGEVVWS